MDDATELLPDEAPENGEWVDTCEVLEVPTEEEIALGTLLGETIDPEDDDSGSENSFRSVGFLAARAPAGNTPRDRALAKARLLKEVMLKHGVPEVSIEIQQGRPSPYGTWDAGFFVADMSHHTVSRYNPRSLTPVLALCKGGRPSDGLGGPLCNGYGGYDLCYRILTFGYANHPGAGGPITVPALTAGSFTIPKDSARRYAWGTEWEGGLSAQDWDRVLTNPRNGKKMTMREFMGRANAALEEFLEIHQNAHLEHSTWTSRKIDRLGYNAAKGIAEKNPYRNPVKKPKKKAVNLKKAQIQFRAYLGLEGSRKPRPTLAVRRIQKALNKKYGVGLRRTGIVNKATSGAWGMHEDRVGIVARRRVPDAATLGVLVKGRYRVKA